ncbi:MAG: PepSY-associated TM helix domain-containing protein [Pseudomonadota bacterium]
MQTLRFKRLVADVHAWTGALVCLLLLLVTLSGIASAFLGDLFRLQYPDLYGGLEFNDDAGGASVDLLVANAATAFDGQFIPLGANLPGGHFDIEKAFVYGGVPDGKGGGELAAVVLNPYTGEILGTHPILSSWAYLVVHFHENLLLGQGGAWTVAVSGVLMLLFVITGLYQWFPRSGRTLQKVTHFRLRGNGRSKMFQLHGLLGFWFAFPVILFAVTGVYIAKPNWLANALPEIQAKTTPEIAERLSQCESGSVSLSDAVSVVTQELPGRRIIGLTMPMPFPQLPPEDAAAYSFATSTPKDIHKHEGDARIWVSATCPGLFYIERVDRSNLRDSVGAMVYSLHSGRSLGPFRLLFVVGSGLVLTALLCAGFYVWWTGNLRKFRKRWNR